MVINLTDSFCNTYMYQIIMLYALSLPNGICQYIAHIAKSGQEQVVQMIITNTMS